MTLFTPKKLRLLAVFILAAAALAACTPEPVEPGGITGRVYLDENANAECEECDCDFYLEDIEVELYRGQCIDIWTQLAYTDVEGIYNFTELEPGTYCVTPNVKTICEGFQATTPIMQTVEVLSGETIEVPWFGFDHYLDHNE